MDKYSVLKSCFGHDSFRQGQEELVDAILSGRDALGIMPTGGGKSLCYQIPARLLPGVTLVISPLISLMKDQVESLRRVGIEAAYINSSLSAEELRGVYREARTGSYKLLYIAPERLETESFRSLMRDREISLVAVDEAHCISQWGQNFRPSYLRIPDFIASLPVRPVTAAFTATATAEVRRDIVGLLRLHEPVCCVTGFDRPNLYFEVQRPESKIYALLRLIRERSGKCGIVYCATRKAVEKVCGMLCECGISAACYHAGMDDDERRQNQEDFQFDRVRVIVATNAFGMGIDKSNVNFVIHYNMPKSLEAYYQEAGRAGRDGEPADCILLYSAADVETAKFLIENSGSAELDEQTQTLVRQRDYERLRAMTLYCKTAKCLRGSILDYFGQPHGESCGNCGNCRGSYRTEDITRQTQMILSCVIRVQEKLGCCVGKALIARTLRGSRDKRVLQLGLDGLSTYGLMREYTAAQVNDYIDYLRAEELLRSDPEHFTLETTPAASAVLFQGKTVTMPVRVEETGRRRERVRDRRRAQPVDEDAGGLYDALRATRMRLSQRENVPVYVVFSNATLTDMAQKKPRTMAEFLQVSGVGEVKAKRYGRDFLRTIAEHGETRNESP